MSPRLLPPALVGIIMLAAVAGCPAPPAASPTPTVRESSRSNVAPAPKRTAAQTGSSQPVVVPGLDSVLPPSLASRAPGSSPAAAGPVSIACAEPGQVGTPLFTPPLPISPNAVAVDATGALWIAFNGRNGLWKATRTAGDGCGWTAAKVPGSESLSDPRDVALDPRGRWLWIADHANHRIARLDTQAATPSVETIAGGAGTFADGPYAEARFWHPAGIAVDQYGAVYVADSYNHRVRRLWNGQVTTVAGGSIAGSGNGSFNYPLGVAVAVPPPSRPSSQPTPTPFPTGMVPPQPAIFVSDTRNHRIVRLQDPPPSATSASTPSPGGQLNGTGDGGGGSSSVVTTPVGKPGFFTVIAGAAGEPDRIDGAGGDARLSMPGGLRYVAGTLWVTDTDNHVVRRISSLGVLAASPTPQTASSPTPPRAAIVSTFAGGSAANDGPLLGAGFRYPRGLAVGPQGELWIADTENDRMRLARPLAASPSPL